MCGIEVGKRGRCKSTPQSFIERLMVAEAKAGRTVVRLKGGDPFIFGRAGEEIEALNEAGVVCEVVNGITSGLAAAAAAGIPLTHRDVTQGVAYGIASPAIMVIGEVARASALLVEPDVLAAVDA